MKQDESLCFAQCDIKRPRATRRPVQRTLWRRLRTARRHALLRLTVWKASMPPLYDWRKRNQSRQKAKLRPRALADSFAAGRSWRSFWHVSSFQVFNARRHFGPQSASFTSTDENRKPTMLLQQCQAPGRGSSLPRSLTCTLRLRKLAWCRSIQLCHSRKQACSNLWPCRRRRLRRRQELKHRRQSCALARHSACHNAAFIHLHAADILSQKKRARARSLNLLRDSKDSRSRCRCLSRLCVIDT